MVVLLEEVLRCGLEAMKPLALAKAEERAILALNN